MKKESRYNEFIKHSTEGIFLIEYSPPIPIDLPAEEQYNLSVKRGRITECNEAIAKMYGFSSREIMLGTRYIDLYKDEGLNKNLEGNIQFIKSNYVLSDIETIEYNTKGEKVFFLNNAVGVIEGGFFTGTWGTQRDITTIKKAENKLIESYDATLKSLAKALELRDIETKNHCQRVENVTLKLAEAMEIQDDDLTHILRGAILHDIGKIGIPDNILLKPGKLTPKERLIMEGHPKFSFDILSQIPFLTKAIDIPYCHHEWWNGQGYPRGLKGEEIPLAARIFSVVDVWDALLSNRPYNKPLTRKATMDYIKKQSGTQFDPQIVDVFLKLIEKGSF